MISVEIEPPGFSIHGENSSGVSSDIPESCNLMGVEEVNPEMSAELRAVMQMPNISLSSTQNCTRNLEPTYWNYLGFDIRLLVEEITP